MEKVAPMNNTINSNSNNIGTYLGPLKEKQSDFLEKATKFFINKGYDPIHAAGIAGNLMHESGGRPDVIHDKGAGIGLAGWNEARRQNLYKFAGTNKPDINQQLEFVDYELKNHETEAYQQLLKSKTPEEAAIVFSQYYERPKKPMLDSRIKYTNQALRGIDTSRVGEERPVGSYLGPSEEKPSVEGWLAGRTGEPLTEAVSSVLDLPSKYVTGPLARTFIDRPLKSLGIPESVDIPIAALQGEGLTFPLAEGTIKAPLRTAATTAAQLGMDVALFSKAPKLVGSLLRKVLPKKVPRISKEEEIYNMLEVEPPTPPVIDPRTAEIDKLIAAKKARTPIVAEEAEIPLEGSIPLGIQARQLAKIDEMAKARGLLPEAEEPNIAILKGSAYSPKETIGREILEGMNPPLVTKSARESAMVLGEAAEAEERLRQSLVGRRALASDLAEQEAKSAMRTGEGFTARPEIDIRDLRAAEAPKGRPFLETNTETIGPKVGPPAPEEILGIRGVIKKYYGGGPDTEDIIAFLKEAKKSGADFKTASIAAAKHFRISESRITDALVGKATTDAAVASRVLPQAGTPIVTKAFKTKLDSTLGPAGTEVQTIPLYTEDVAVRLNGTGDIKLPMLAGQKFSRTLKTNERLFSEMDDIYPGFRESFYRPLKAAENTAHRATIEIFDQIDSLKKTLPARAGIHIGVDQIAKRATGAERLSKMGITPTPLTSSEQVVSDRLKEIYKDYLSRMNEARALAGRQPIPESDEYIPFMVNFLDRVGTGYNPILEKAEVFAAPVETPFRFKNPLTGATEKVAMDAFKIVKNYAALAEKHIAISPQLERIRKFQTGFKLPDGTEVPPLSKVSPNMNLALLHMRKAISGVKEPMNRAERILALLSDNIVISVLSAYPRSVVNQIGSLAAGAAETNLDNMIKGIMTMLKPGKWREAHSRSNMLAQRVMDISLESVHGGRLGHITGKLKHWAMIPLEVTDDFMATATWWAGMYRAEQLGLKGRKALNFADDIIPRTQASASAIDRAMIQNDPFGRFFTAFQTFTIADANWIARHVLGIGNLNFKGSEGFKKLVTMTLVGIGLNYLQRELIGMPPGLPEPIHAYQEATMEEAGPVETAWRVGKEFMPFIPIIGGSLAFGKVPGGAIGSTIGDLVTGQKSIPETAALMSGIPGIKLGQNLLRTEEGEKFLKGFGESVGWPHGSRKGRPTEPYTLGQAMFGREPVKSTKRHKKWKIDRWLLGE